MQRGAGRGVTVATEEDKAIGGVLPLLARLVVEALVNEQHVVGQLRRVHLLQQRQQGEEALVQDRTHANRWHCG